MNVRVVFEVEIEGYRLPRRAHTRYRLSRGAEHRQQEAKRAFPEAAIAKNHTDLALIEKGVEEERDGFYGAACREHNQRLAFAVPFEHHGARFLNQDFPGDAFVGGREAFTNLLP